MLASAHCETKRTGGTEGGALCSEAQRQQERDRWPGSQAAVLSCHDGGPGRLGDGEEAALESWREVAETPRGASDWGSPVSVGVRWGLGEEERARG